MNKKIGVIILLAMSVILAGTSGSFAYPQYLTSLNTVYGNSSCGACHVKASGGGPLTSYGTLFENQPNHVSDPGAALRAIGLPPAATPITAPTATLTPTVTTTLTATSPRPETPIATETPPVTTVTATETRASPGFGFVVSLIGLFSFALLARKQ